MIQVESENRLLRQEVKSKENEIKRLHSIIDNYESKYCMFHKNNTYFFSGMGMRKYCSNLHLIKHTIIHSLNNMPLTFS